MSGDVPGAELAGRYGGRGEGGGGGGGGLHYHFLKIEKIALIIWKNALIVLILRLNVHLCFNSKCYFKST